MYKELFLLNKGELKLKKAIFWDFDGTLVHANESFLLSLSSALCRYNYTIEKSVLKEFLISVCSWYVPEKDYTNKILDEWWNTLFENVMIFCGKNEIGEEESRLICEAFRDNVLHYEYQLYSDAEETLACCKEKGYENYLLTNNYPEIVKIVEGFGLGNYFCDYFVSSRIGYEKPRIELYLHALREAGNPNVCYMVGDNPIADIRGAQNAGLKAILVHEQSAECKPDYYCEELAEIIRIL